MAACNDALVPLPTTTTTTAASSTLPSPSQTSTPDLRCADWMRGRQALPLSSRAVGTAIRTATTATPSSARRIFPIGAWSQGRGRGAVGEKVRKQQIQSDARKPPHPPPPPLPQVASFKQTKGTRTIVFLSAVHRPGASHRHTHTRTRAQVVVSETGVAVKYYLAQSFKGETIKRVKFVWLTRWKRSEAGLNPFCLFVCLF